METGGEVAKFRQEAPRYGNQYLENSAMRSILRRQLPPHVYQRVSADLEPFGWRVVRELPAQKATVLQQPPTLVQYDGWGRRIDEVRLGSGWQHMHNVAAEEGLIAIGYGAGAPADERAFARVHQMMKVALFEPVSAVFTCPLAMTDGAALLLSRRKLQGTATPSELATLEHFLARDGRTFWTSGQWMTERPGGSDVGRTETIARKVSGLGSTDYELHGYKFFTSASLSDTAFALARIEDDSGQVVQGSRGLSLFCVRLRDEHGRLDRIRVHKLKDKMGTVALPTAELELIGTPAQRVGDEGRGVPTIATLFNVTRIWAANSSLGGFRKALAVARDYAHRRYAFGKPLTEHSLHVSFLAQLEATYRGLLQFVVHVCLLEGAVEAAEVRKERPDPAWSARLRLLTPLLKLQTAKLASAGILECIEALGGLGFMNDATDLPDLFGNAFVNVIWEGTTNIMALDMLRALGSKKNEALELVLQDILRAADLADSRLPQLAHMLRDSAAQVRSALLEPNASDGARDVAYCLAAMVSSGLLVEQAAWAEKQNLASEALVDWDAANLWMLRHLRPLLPLHLPSPSASRNLGLDVDPATDQPRGCGNTCPFTGQPRASY